MATSDAELDLIERYRRSNNASAAWVCTVGIVCTAVICGLLVFHISKIEVLADNHNELKKVVDESEKRLGTIIEIRQRAIEMLPIIERIRMRGGDCVLFDEQLLGDLESLSMSVLHIRSKKYGTLVGMEVEKTTIYPADGVNNPVLNEKARQIWSD